MKGAKSEIPIPGNPYRIPAAFVGALWISGALAMAWSCGAPRAQPLPFFLGVMSLTLAFILSIGVGYGWQGFRKRFGPGRVIAYWEIAGFDWDSFVSRRRRVILRGGMAATLLLPAFAAGTIVALAWSDGELLGAVPIAAAVWLGTTAMFLAILGCCLGGLRGKCGRVWLTERGILVNGDVFFSDSYGITVLQSGVEHRGGSAEVVVRYRIQGGGTAGEHDLRIPVPAGHLGIAEKTTAGWVSGG